MLKELKQSIENLKENWDMMTEADKLSYDYYRQLDSLTSYINLKKEEFKLLHREAIRLDGIQLRDRKQLRLNGMILTKKNDSEIVKIKPC